MFTFESNVSSNLIYFWPSSCMKTSKNLAWNIIMAWTKTNLWISYSRKETYLCYHDLEVLVSSYTKAHCKTLTTPLQETYLLDDWHLNCFKSRLKVWFVKILPSFCIFFLKKHKTNIKLCTQSQNYRCLHSPALRTARFKPLQAAKPKV